MAKGEELQKQIRLAIDESGETPKFLTEKLQTEPIRATAIATTVVSTDSVGASITIPNDTVVGMTRLVYGGGVLNFPSAEGIRVDFERVLNGAPTTIHSVILAAPGPIVEVGSLKEPLLEVAGGSGADVVLFRIVFRHEATFTPIPANVKVFSNVTGHRLQPRLAQAVGL